MGYQMLQISPRKFAVVETDESKQVLNGNHVIHCGSARIVFGPSTNYSAVANELVKLSRCKKCGGNYQNCPDYIDKIKAKN